MGMIGNLVKAFKASATGKRTWTPIEIRELIARKDLDTARVATAQLSESVKHLEAERACLLGEIAFHEQQDEEALLKFREALKSFPGLAEAHYGLSLVLSAQGQFDDAVRHAQFALGALRKNGRYLAQLGYCHLCLGNFQVAEGPLRRATLEMPGNAYLWNNLGIVLRVKGEAEEAQQCFERATALDPGLESAREHLVQLNKDIDLGRVRLSVSTDNSHTLKASVGPLDDPAFQDVLELERTGELQQAINACETLLLERPDDERAPVLLSRLYERVGDVESAADALVAYLSTHPDSAHVAGALGLVKLRAQEFRAAESLLRRALAAHEDHLDYVVGMGRALSGQERFVEAGPYFERAVELAPEDLGIVGQRTSNLANQCRYEEAMLIIDELTARGVFVGCQGSVLAFLGRFDEALAALNKDVARQPSDPGLRTQRAHLNLLLGNYEVGWSDYSFRGLSSAKSFRMLPFPLWRGEPLKGKRVIVLTEQGLGDQIMFASCLPDLLAMEPERIVVEMSKRVAATIARSFPSCEVVASNQNADMMWATDYPDTDCFVPLADLPGHFRLKPEDFPRHDGYLKADPVRVAHWRGVLEASGPGPYIGVSWRGGTELTRGPVRTLEPEQLEPLGTAVAATWVCLQYGEVQPQVDRMAHTSLPLQYWPESISDLDEFAALISALDLVITVCNTTVHYAGALGQPVWILAPKVPEWRYGLTSTSLPWYPSSRMYRQHEAGAWTELVATVRQDLSVHFDPA